MVSSDSDSNCSGYSSNSDLSDLNINSLADSILGKLSIYPGYEVDKMTIKNRKDRLKSDRPPDSTGSSSSGTRHSHGFKPYSYGEDRKDSSHRNRVRNHQPDSTGLIEPSERSHSYTPYPLLENSIFQSSATFSRPQRVLPSPSPSDVLVDVAGIPYEPRSIVPETSKVGLSVVESETGNNSEDEYYTGAIALRSPCSQSDETGLEKMLMEKKGWKIVKVKPDGGCLFRSVSHQIFGDEEKHDVVRKQVVEYMLKNKEHFSPYITEEFERYIERKKDPTCYGNHVEIQAISELYNRPVEIYHDSVDPVNVFHGDYSKEFPIRLSYHGRVHYNSVVDPFNPTYGHGLGMPNYQPSLAEPELISQAINASEMTQLDEAVLRDKLAESEQGEIERCMEDQAVADSYLDYVHRLQQQTTQAVSSSSASLSVATAGCNRSTIVQVIRPSIQDFGDMASSSRAAFPPVSTTCTPISHMPSTSAQHASASYLPPEFRDMDDDAILSMVLEQSRQEYLSTLRMKHSSPNSDSLGAQGFSPTPVSTSPHGQSTLRISQPPNESTAKQTESTD